jgi:3-methyladenine DNA glycosylase AlkD
MNTKQRPGNKYYREIMEMLQKESDENPMHGKHSAQYLGGKGKLFDVSNAQIRTIAKEWYQKNKELETEEIFELIDSLIMYGDYDQTAVAGMMLKAYKRLREDLEIARIDKWLGYTEGWAEIDVLCQTTFPAEEMLENWDGWRQLLKQLNQSENLAKQRASLVLLTAPVRNSSDPRLVKIALSNIDNLKHMKHKLITKAISWLLREMVKTNRSAVENYLDKNNEDLPAVAVRETRNKLETGTK